MWKGCNWPRDITRQVTERSSNWAKRSCLSELLLVSDFYSLIIKRC